MSTLGELKKDTTSGWFGSNFAVDVYDGGVGVNIDNTYVSPTPIYSTGINHGLNPGMVTNDQGYQVPAAEVDGSTSLLPDFSVGSAHNQGSTVHNTIAGDPVNMVTGNMWHDETDLQLPTRGLDLIFKRTYNSADTQIEGSFGPGWTHTFNQTLAFRNGENDQDRHIVWRNGTGSEKLIKAALTGSDCPADATCKTGAVNLSSNNVTIPRWFLLHPGAPSQQRCSSPYCHHRKNRAQLHL